MLYLDAAGIFCARSLWVKKILIGGAMGMMAIITIILCTGILSLGQLVKHAINFYGPTITMTDVSVGDVSIALRSGRATVQNFYLGSPKGFAEREAVKIRSFFIDLEEKTLAEPLIVINRIEIERPVITYEKKETTDNLRAILENITQKIGAAKPREQVAASQAGSAKQMLIRHLVMRNGTVRFVTPLLGSRRISVSLPSIAMRNVGQIENGASPEEICRQVLSGLYEKITGSAVTGAINQQLKGLGLDLGKIEQNAMRGAQPMAERFKGLFGGQP